MYTKFVKLSIIILFLCKALTSFAQPCYYTATVVDNNNSTNTTYQFYVTTETKVRIVFNFLKGTGTYSDMSGSFVRLGVGSGVVDHIPIEHYLPSSQSYIHDEKEYILSPSVGNYYLTVNIPYTLGDQSGISSKHIQTNAYIYFLPLTKTVSGGGDRCSDDPPTRIYLNNSQAGVNYSLVLGSQTIGSSQPGNGSTLNWYVSDPGTYKISATTSSGCPTDMANTVKVSEYQAPTKYTLTYGDSRCTNNNAQLRLLGSQTSIRYQLMRGTEEIGTYKEGTGSALTWNIAEAGKYHVIARSYEIIPQGPVTIYHCTGTMNGTPEIFAPPMAYDVSGGGGRCFDGPKLSVKLNNSQLNVDYYLYLNGVDQNYKLDGGSGATNPLSWTDLEITGNYTIKGVNPYEGSCSSWMNYSANITTHPNPTIIVASDQNFIVYPGLPVTTLTASGASTYVWGPNEDISSTIGSVIQAYPRTSKDYTVEGTSAEGCKSTKKFRITAALDIMFSVSNNEITVSARGGLPPYTFAWNNGTTGNQIAPNKDGTYSVTVTDSEGTSWTESYKLSYYSSNDKNYIHSYCPRVEMVEIPESFELEDISETVQYFDGLGRHVQIVNTGASPEKKTLVQPIVYDNFNRISFKYLPYVTEDAAGLFRERNEWGTDQKGFYNGLFTGQGDYALAQTEFEPSPLDRVLKQGSAGESWQLGQGHEVEFAYETNTANDIIIWEVNESITEVNSNLVSNSGSFYAAGQLYVTKTTDENKHWTRDYKNMAGQVIMTESMPVTGTPGNIRTYYVYDDLELLRCVIPPKAESTVNDDLCYFYRYDGKRRMIAKKIPGADAIYMVYDNRDRLVLTQDGNMRDKTPKQWMATKYEDTFNRPILTGIIEDDRSHEAIITDLDSDVEYAFPAIENMELLSKTYYDAYSNIDFDLTHYGFENAFSLGNSSSNLKGQIVATITYVPETGQELKTVNYYDRKYRVIQTTGDNHLGGKDVVSTGYDFTGQVLETKQAHYKNTKTVVSNSIDKRFDYDHAGRLKTVEIKFDTETDYHIITENNYDVLGQLTSKNTHRLEDGSYLLNGIYTYNIRGWMTTNTNNNNGITLFDVGLHYQTGAKPMYNGNISRMTWNSSLLGELKSYEYSYDEINRLTEADYTGTDESYSTSYSYDKNGNIDNLIRYGFMESNGFGVIDNLNYTYQGNRLIGVNDINDPNNLNPQAFGFSDGGTFKTPVIGDLETHEYFYDNNGNLETDLNKGLNTILYNHLNLPDFVLLPEKKAIDYVYDAAGIKLKQLVLDDGIIIKETDYIGNFVYEDGSLKFILTDDGRLVPKTGGGFDYEYFIKDHLGNTRVTVADQNNDGIAEVMQEDHYYPFGMTMEGMSYQNPLQKALNKYLYNGKELQDDLGLGWYDYGARFYDAQIGRWHTKDPMMELHYNYTPFAYVYNNPISYIDLYGLDTTKLDDRTVVTNTNGDGKTSVTAYLNGNSSQSSSSSGGYIYTQVTSNTLIKSKPGWYNRPEYNFILPQNSGKWGEPGSDGLIWIGCMACHGLNGAYHYAAYNSGERYAGLAFGTTIAIFGSSYLMDIGNAARNVVEELNFGSLAKTGKIDPSKVRFSQSSISGSFKDGGNLDDFITGLKNGTIDPNDIPAIRIVEKDGLIYTLDNRRLYSFQKAGTLINYQKINAIPKNQLFKFTSTNQGASIIVR